MTLNPDRWDDWPVALSDIPAEEVGPVLSAAVRKYVAVRKNIGEFRPLTARGVRWTLTSFVDSAGDRPLARYRRRHVERWLADMDCADSTRRTRLSQLRTFWRWANDTGITRTDPTRGVKGPRVVRLSPRGFDADQVARLLAHADRRMTVVVLLAVQEGLRRAEIVGLSTSDIDWQARLLLVRGKGGHERWVPLSDETAVALAAYAPRRPGVPVVCSEVRPAAPISANHLGRLMTGLCQTAGVKAGPFDGVSLHAGRHTCANDVLDVSGDLRAVQELLGHQSVSTTAVYQRRQVAAGRIRAAAAGRQYGNGRLAGTAAG